MYYLNLYFKFITVYVKSKLEYRFAFYTDLFIQIFTYSIMYLNIWIMFSKFNQMDGWSFYEVIFIYNLNLFTYGISGLFIWGPMRQVESMVHKGTFDSILTKPLKPFLHMIFRQFEHSFLGHVILGIFVFFICFSNLHIKWSLLKIIWLIIVIIGGVLIQASIMILGGAVCFWTVKSTSVIDTAIYGLRFFSNYPITIFNKWVQFILTFIVPYAFVNFYPSQFFLDKSGHFIFPPFFQYGTPIVGIILFLISYNVWNLGVSKYQSVGS